MCTVASAPAAFRVRVWQVTSWGRSPRARRSPPESASVGYPHSLFRSKRSSGRCSNDAHLHLGRWVKFDSPHLRGGRRLNRCVNLILSQSPPTDVNAWKFTGNRCVNRMGTWELDRNSLRAMTSGGAVAPSALSEDLSANPRAGRRPRSRLRRDRDLRDGESVRRPERARGRDR